MPANCIARVIEIFYLSQTGKLSIRRVKIMSIRDGIIKAICLDGGTWRSFRVDRVLSWEFVKEEQYA